MSISITKNAELFFRALDDAWCAEQIYRGSPNNAAWHCNQCVEKLLKGILRCYNIEYQYEHGLEGLLEKLEEVVKVSDSTIKDILFIDKYGTALRYKNMKNDPSIQEMELSINKVQNIIAELSNEDKVKKYFFEAKEVHDKIIK